MKIRKCFEAIPVVAAVAVGALQMMAQGPASPPRDTAPAASAPAIRRPGGFRSAFPQRAAADSAGIERGKAIYGVNCNFCHGSDARGGEGGPNLLRSELILNDQKGELLAPVVQNGRGEMPKFNLSPAQISDVAAFLHSFRVGGYDISRMTPPSILSGDAKAGEAYFDATCASCHSVTGDLKGIGARFTDAKQLQQIWLMPGNRRRGFGALTSPAIRVRSTTVTVQLAPGQKMEGRLVRMDDFFVTLIDGDGAERTFARDGDRPKVTVHDPLEPHKELLPKYTDADIHNLTAYLVTLK